MWTGRAGCRRRGGCGCGRDVRDAEDVEGVEDVDVQCPGQCPEAQGVQLCYSPPDQRETRSWQVPRV